MMSIFLVLIELDANPKNRQNNNVLSILTVKNFVKSCQGYTALVMIPESGIPVICIHTHTYNRTTLTYLIRYLGRMRRPMQSACGLKWTLVFSGKIQMTILLKWQPYSDAARRKTIHSAKEQRRFMKTAELDCLVKAWTKTTVVQEIPILS